MLIQKKLMVILFASFIFYGCAGASRKSLSVPEPHISKGKHKSELSGSLINNKTNKPVNFNNVSEISPPNKGEGDNAIDNSENDVSSYTAEEMAIQPILDEALEITQAAQEFWQKGDVENAIQSLDQAYLLIINVDTNDSPKLTQQKEDLRFMISKRILEIYASRHTVVNGNHNAIPMTINKSVQEEIDRFTVGNDKEFFQNAYKRSGRYRQQIIKKLKEAGLPESLSWLPLIESGFKTNALSKARALGLWQFIPSTGCKFGLTRDMYIDERLDPDKSTVAAISYLKALHQLFGDWTTVLAAYNCGEGRILNIIRTQNINYLDNFWDLYGRIPQETARYVPMFLATLHIVNNPEKYGLKDLAVDSPMEYETVDVSKQIRLKDIADKLGSSEDVLAALNPELRYKMLPAESYSLKIPPGKKELFLSSIGEIPATIAEIPVTSPQSRSFVYYKVKPGQTLATIAKRYGVSATQIAHANNLHRTNRIDAGRLLKIPMIGKYIPTYKKDNNSQGDLVAQHIVKRGDSLWNIAKRYGTTAKNIQKINKLGTKNLFIGQALKVPGGEAENSPVEGLKTYQVKPGDNVFSIAKQHNMPLNLLYSLNNLTSKSTIFPGQQLYVK